MRGPARTVARPREIGSAPWNNPLLEGGAGAKGRSVRHNMGFRDPRGKQAVEELRGLAPVRNAPRSFMTHATTYTQVHSQYLLARAMTSAPKP